VNLDPLEAEVLGWLLEECGSPQTLSDNLALQFGRSATEASVAAAIGRLVAMGFAQVYDFDPSSKTFRPIELKNPPLDKWFAATQVGRDTVERLT
jgi:hypothetical protein